MSSRLSAMPFAPASPALASQLSIGSASTPPAACAWIDSISSNSSSSLERSVSLSSIARVASGESSTFTADSRMDRAEWSSSLGVPAAGVESCVLCVESIPTGVDDIDPELLRDDISADKLASVGGSTYAGGLNVNSSDDRRDCRPVEESQTRSCSPVCSSLRVTEWIGVGGEFSLLIMYAFSGESVNPKRWFTGGVGAYSRLASSTVVLTMFHRASAAARSAATLAAAFSFTSTGVGQSLTVAASTAVRSFHPFAAAL